MRNVRALFVPVIIAALVIGCGGFDHPTHPTTNVIGSGHLVTEVRPVSEFSAVSVSGAGRLIIEYAGYESLQVTAEDNILPLLRAEVRDGRLELGTRPHAVMNTTREILYRLTVRELSGIDASGASLVEARSIDTEHLRVALSGAATAELAGIADQQHVEVSGASRLVADGLDSRQVVASVSGVSFARVRVSNWLSASASGASTLEYLGDPTLSLSVSGSSVIRRVGR